MQFYISLSVNKSIDEHRTHVTATNIIKSLTSIEALYDKKVWCYSSCFDTSSSCFPFSSLTRLNAVNNVLRHLLGKVRPRN